MISRKENAPKREGGEETNKQNTQNTHRLFALPQQQQRSVSNQKHQHCQLLLRLQNKYKSWIE